MSVDGVRGRMVWQTNNRVKCQGRRDLITGGSGQQARNRVVITLHWWKGQHFNFNLTYDHRGPMH